MKKRLRLFLVLSGLSFLPSLCGGQTYPRVFVDRFFEINGFIPRENNFQIENKREARLLRLVSPPTAILADSVGIQTMRPQKNKPLLVFYDSVFQGTVIPSRFEIKKNSNGVFGLFDFDRSSLPMTLNGTDEWENGAVYVSAPTLLPHGVKPMELSADHSQQLFARMMTGLQNPPAIWRVQHWMTQFFYGKSLSFPDQGVYWIELKAKHTWQNPSQIVVCRAGDRLRVFQGFTQTAIDQAFQVSGMDYVVLTRVGEHFVWRDVYQVDSNQATWMTGHRQPVDPQLGAVLPNLTIQKEKLPQTDY
jgi:hypothetical protein